MKQHQHAFTLTEPIHIKDAIRSIREYQQQKPNIPLLPYDTSFLIAAGQYEIIPGKWEFTYTLEKIIRLEKIDQ